MPNNTVSIGLPSGGWQTLSSITTQPSQDLGDIILQGLKKAKSVPEPQDGEKFYNRVISQVVLFRNKKQEGLIGLEIEVEGKKLFNTPFAYWSCHEDGSLRAVDESPPIEYVLKKPLDMPEVIKALNYLENKLKEAGSSIVLSNRTSVHVHLNVQKWTIRQLYCFILLYIIFEEVLVDWSGPERAGNLFCLRAKDSNFYVEMLESVLKGSNLKAWQEDYRYSACNVSSVTKFGSLEFRSLRGTVDMKLIQTWIELLLHLREKSLGYDNPIEITEEFQRMGPLPFFRHVFDKTNLRNLLERDSHGLSGKLWDGMRISRDVAHCCEWVPPQKKKENEQPQEESQISLSTLKANREVILNGESRVIKAYYNSSGTVQFVDEDDLNGNFLNMRQILPNRCMYYVDSLEHNFHWIILDERQGPIEYEGVG